MHEVLQSNQRLLLQLGGSTVQVFLKDGLAQLQRPLIELALVGGAAHPVNDGLHEDGGEQPDEADAAESGLAVGVNPVKHCVVTAPAFVLSQQLSQAILSLHHSNANAIEPGSAEFMIEDSILRT